MNQENQLINEPYRLHARQLRRLVQFWMAGKGDSPEADALRDEMDFSYDPLTVEQQNSVGGLAGDLNWALDGARPGKEPREQAFQKYLPVLLAAQESKDWHGVLEALRPLESLLPAAEVAFLRGRAWTYLGDDETALLFFEHAQKLDPKDKAFAWVARDCLADNGTTAAAAQAEEVRR